MIYAYYRVSTDKQDYNSQKTNVLDFCRQRNYTIDKEIIDDGVSGCIEAKKRNLQYILDNTKENDLIITSELSRFGRSTRDVLNTCEILNKKGVQVWFVKNNMGLDDSPTGKLLRTIFIAFAELERDLISQRTKDGLRRVKEQGTILGRPTGKKNNVYMLDKYKDKILEMLEQGYCIRDIAFDIGVHRMTISRYLDFLKIDKKKYFKLNKEKRMNEIKEKNEQKKIKKLKQKRKLRKKQAKQREEINIKIKKAEEYLNKLKEKANEL